MKEKNDPINVLSKLARFLNGRGKKYIPADMVDIAEVTAALNDAIVALKRAISPHDLGTLLNLATHSVADCDKTNRNAALKAARRAARSGTKKGA